MAPKRSKQKNRAGKKASKKSAARVARRPARRRAPAVKAGDLALAAFAHDIRTALTGILALGELLASSNIGTRERDWAAAIKTGAEHLSALTVLMVDAASDPCGRTDPAAGSISSTPNARGFGGIARGARADQIAAHAKLTIADGLPDLLVGDPVRLRAALEAAFCSTMRR